MDGLTNPTDMVVSEGILYFADYGTGKISKVKLGIANPPITDVASGFGGPFGLAIRGNQLYIAEYDSNQVSKIDISQGNPTKQLVWLVQGISDLEFVGDTLFAVNFDKNKIDYEVMSQTNPSLSIYASGMNGPFRIRNHDSILYISEATEGKVSWINRHAQNLTLQTKPANFSSPGGLAIYNETLYVAENKADKISSINLTNTGSKKLELSNLDGPDVLMVYNKTLFISEFDKGQISMISLNPVSVWSIKTKKLELFPNPCIDFIKIKNIKEGSLIRIYHASGRLVLEEKVDSTKKVDIQNLSAGLYSIQSLEGSLSAMLIVN